MNQNNSPLTMKIGADQIGQDDRFNVRFVLLNHDNVEDLSRVWAAWKKLPDTHIPPPPIKVWHDGENYIVVDGHHRLAAFRKTFKPNRKGTRCTAKIECEVVTGGLTEALIATVRDNKQKQAGLSKTERTNAAWKLVRLTDLSKNQIATETGTRTTTVARMRKAYLRHTSGELKEEPKPTWKLQAEFIQQVDMTLEEINAELNGEPKGGTKWVLEGEARSKFISRASSQLRNNLRRECWYDDEFLAEVIQATVGENRMNKVMDWLVALDDDEHPSALVGDGGEDF
ncbi:ParB/Srx family N-terminal domain-containing protein [Ruegeria atlantica]|uniref:ParB-like nuclease domain protein n=1 Tax=Ruegeria atlantica TaxID=81569 RepID=A0A0N7LN65_9RHOB|nr:ParB/Srx family N-terminal domain-containing protein [Ruegeria atlantica]CUH41556.1 hypothetical protein RUM4293_00430 [Ruegeria atlantica]